MAMLTRLPKGWGEGACFRGINDPWKPYAEYAIRKVKPISKKKEKRKSNK